MDNSQKYKTECLARWVVAPSDRATRIDRLAAVSKNMTPAAAAEFAELCKKEFAQKR